MFTSIDIYTDGACSGNPGPGGTGFCIIVDGIVNKKMGNGYRKTTNNRMEILAVVEALNCAIDSCKELKMKRDTDVKVTVFSDSQLVVNTMNEGWRIRSNNDLWVQLKYNLNKFKELYPNAVVSFSKVKGHSDNKYNNIVDQLAVAASQKPMNIDTVYEQISKPEPVLFEPIIKEKITVVNVRFLGMDTPQDRKIEAELSNGTIARIITCYEGFQTVNCTKEESSLVVDIALAYNAWLHGGKFIK